MPAQEPRRALLTLVLTATFLSAGLLATAFPSVSGAAPDDSPLVQRAYRDLDTYQGECWPWVRRVVQDSLGLTMGFDYIQGFFDAGAHEVAIADAAPGDVIQLADDAEAGPTADYPGLHTAIVVAVESPGVFTVIDSNSQWDGVVRVRTGYDPAASAARFSNITFHVYRFPDGSEASQPPPAGTGQVEPGRLATVAAPSDCLNLRSGAQVADNVLICLPDGMRVRLLGPTANADGYAWVQIESSLGIGWVASAFLRPGPPDHGDTGGDAGAEPEAVHRTFVGAVAANAGMEP